MFVNVIKYCVKCLILAVFHLTSNFVCIFFYYNEFEHYENQLRYPMDRDLSTGQCYPPFEQYSARPIRFGSRGPSEAVPARSPRTRHRSNQTEAWENAVQGLGKDQYCDREKGEGSETTHIEKNNLFL